MNVWMYKEINAIKLFKKNAKMRVIFFFWKSLAEQRKVKELVLPVRLSVISRDTEHLALSYPLPDGSFLTSTWPWKSDLMEQHPVMFWVIPFLRLFVVFVCVCLCMRMCVLSQYVVQQLALCSQLSSAVSMSLITDPTQRSEGVSSERERARLEL